MTPDWAQRPNGTTHWARKTKTYRECWFRNVDGKWSFMTVGLSKNWMPMQNPPTYARICGMKVRP